MNDDPGSEPVVVFGCDGETGMRVVDVIISHGVPVRLVHHTSIDPSKKTYPSHIRGIPVQHVVARVEIAEEVANAVKGSRAVVCTVGIQPVIPRGVIQDFDTGDAGVFAVGYANLAQMCIKYRVPRLVVLDSTCTYPSNTCRSMVRGEKAIRATYSRANGSENKLGYSIVRSGRLYNGEERGPQEIEVHQGKEKSGLLSRQDAAHMLAEEALDPKLARTTVEAYYTDSAQPTDMGRAMDLCKKNGVSMKECFLGKQKNGRSVVFPTTKEHHSDGGWRNLFKGVREDQDLEEEEGIPDVETYFGVDSN